MATKKKKAGETRKGGFNTNNAKWVKAVRYYINGDCDGKQEKCMLKAGFAKTTSRTYNYMIKKHPDYLAWQKTQTKKNLITKEFLEEQLYRIITAKKAGYAAQVAAIGKAMEMFGFIAPKKVDLGGEIKHNHILFAEVVHIMDKVDREKNDRNNSKNRIAKYSDN